MKSGKSLAQVTQKSIEKILIAVRSEDGTKTDSCAKTVQTQSGLLTSEWRGGNGPITGSRSRF